MGGALEGRGRGKSSPGLGLTGRSWRCPRDTGGQGPGPGISSPSLASSSDKASMSFSRAVCDSWIWRSISSSLAPTFGRKDGRGRTGEAGSARGAPCWPRGQEEVGGSTRTCSASSSSRLRAPAASSSREACRSVARVWLDSRLARWCSFFPSLSKALASCGWAVVQGKRVNRVRQSQRELGRHTSVRIGP